MSGLSQDLPIPLQPKSPRRRVDVCARCTRSFLHGMSAYDLISYLPVSGVGLVASLGFVLLPARRAAKVHPLGVLRYE
jgi:ABC-type antimicrobial peptide transport system permease subunit